MDERDRERIALVRYQLIAPLLDPDTSPEDQRAYRQSVLEKTDPKVSERTLRRYMQAFREQGFGGLYPRQRSDRGLMRSASQEVLSEAVGLKRELPQRSVERLITILEAEGRVAPGQIKRSTLARHLAATGVNRLPKKPQSGYRRFQREHRNALWQSDLKFGPYIPDPKDPKRKVSTYLIAFIDDYSRLVPHAQFYLEQKQPALEHCFRQAILKRGLPKQVFVDNGKIFVSHWFRLACARLGIRHLTARPYAPESKGKIERFMGTVDAFVAEVGLLKPKTLHELNEAFWGWLEEAYNHAPHDALKRDTPANVFSEDTTPLRLATVRELRDVFLWEESRQADRTGCFKLQGRIYDAGPERAGKKLTVRFDPFDLKTVELWQNGTLLGTAGELHLDGRRDAPPVEETPPPATSRYLNAVEQQAATRRKRRLGAIAFRNLGGEDDV